MSKSLLPAICIAITTIITSCNKKHTPQASTASANKSAVIAAKKPTAKKPQVVPKVIMVNDSVAKKNIDGKLYYDLNGHRYWRNYDDGKYYLFNQSMYTDKAFKPH